MMKKSDSDLFNVEINHPMFSLHYVAESVPIKNAVQIARKYSKILCPLTVFIEKIYQKDGTTVHESISYYDFVKNCPAMKE